MKYTIATKNWVSKYVDPKEIQFLEEWFSIENRVVDPSEYEALGIPVFVEIKIPLQVFGASVDLQQKLSQIALMFSEIKRKVKDWVIVVSNIALHYITEFLTAQEYERLKSVWVEFSSEIEDLFLNDGWDE